MTSPIDVCFAINACRQGDEEALRQSLGPDSPSPVFDQPNSESLLELAIVSGSAACVRVLIEAGAPVNPPAFSTQEPPLIRAAHGHSDAIFQLLLEAGADPEAGGALPSPLMIAAMDPTGSRCALLLSKGARADFSSPHDKTFPTSYRAGRQAIHYAASLASPGALKALLEAGADPDAPDAVGKSARDYALASKHPRAKPLAGILRSFTERQELSRDTPLAAERKRSAGL